MSIAAYTAAPNATASSGFMDLLSALPLKKSYNNSYTFGIRVDPPTNTTSSIYDLETPESVRTLSTCGIHYLKRSIISSSNLALVIVIVKSSFSPNASTSIEV